MLIFLLYFLIYRNDFCREYFNVVIKMENVIVLFIDNFYPAAFLTINMSCRPCHVFC